MFEFSTTLLIDHNIVNFMVTLQHDHKCSIKKSLECESNSIDDRIIFNSRTFINYR